jgi:hypothetical protein
MTDRSRTQALERFSAKRLPRSSSQRTRAVLTESSVAAWQRWAVFNKRDGPISVPSIKKWRFLAHFGAFSEGSVTDLKYW